MPLKISKQLVTVVCFQGEERVGESEVGRNPTFYSVPFKLPEFFKITTN